MCASEEKRFMRYKTYTLDMLQVMRRMPRGQITVLLFLLFALEVISFENAKASFKEKASSNAVTWHGATALSDIFLFLFHSLFKILRLPNSKPKFYKILILGFATPEQQSEQ